MMTVARYAIFALCLIAGTAGYALYERTLVVWWWPVAAAVAVAAATMPLLCRRWQWLTDSDSRTLNLLCHLYIVSLSSYFCLVGGNFLLSDSASSHEESVVVSEVMKKQHKRYRRLTHNRVVQSGVTYSYYMKVMFADSTSKRLRLSAEAYGKTRPNSCRTVYLERGFFGFPVIRYRDRSGACGAPAAGMQSVE